VAVLAVGTTAQAAGSLGTVASPSPGADYNELDGVASVTASNAWAVGFQRSTGLLFHVLVEHSNGTAWSVAASAARPAADDTRLHAVAAVTSSDIWAVGSETTFTPTTSNSRSLIEHWNGTAWSVVPSPAGEPANSVLLAITAVSASDVWAVGHSTLPIGQSDGTLIEHWNGLAWSIVQGASLVSTGNAYLLSVAAVSSSDVWAVGRNGRHPTPVIEHWDGASWTQVTQPVSGYDSGLNSVAVISATDIWAVGEQNLFQTVTEHWDGTSWTLVPSPSVTANSAQDILSSVVALGHGDVWAVGSTIVDYKTLAEHWDGTSWQLVPSANSTAGANALSAASGTAAGQPLWAVGFSSSSGTPQFTTLVETTTG